MMIPMVERSKPVKILAALLLVLLFATVPLILGHLNAGPDYSFTQSAGEGRAERAFGIARGLGEPRLYAFLRNMPKGADLHMHLSGAIYAETFIDEAAREGLCVALADPGKPAVPQSQDALTFVAPQNKKPSTCAKGQLPVSAAINDQKIYDDLIDSLSMRAFVPVSGIDGHDQFFSTFARFGGLQGVEGEWLNEVATRAAAQNEQYLEIMQTPTLTNAAKLGNQLGWPAGAEHSITSQQLATLRDALLAAGLRD